MKVELTTWNLEMLARQQLRPKVSQHPDLIIRQAELPSPEFSRFLYTSVGGDWYWRDRLKWTDDRWAAYLQSA